MQNRKTAMYTEKKKKRTSAPLCMAPVHLYHSVHSWSRKEGEGESVCVYVLRQKGVLLPQDVAFKAEEVGFLWRKRSQNRRLLR